MFSCLLGSHRYLDIRHRQSIQSSAESNEGYAREFADIPLVGRTIFEQQQLLYRALLEWLDHFEGQFLEE